MNKKVLDVGQCDIDNWQISQMLVNHFEADVSRAKTHQDALDAMSQGAFDLVLINRINDVDGSEGMELLRSIKQMPDAENTCVMIVSNFEETQKAAVEVGATFGFGKADLNEATTLEKLASVLK